MVLGTYMVLGFFVTAANAMTQTPLVYQLGEGSAKSPLANAALSYAVRVGSAAFFQLLPGLYVLAKSESLAERFAPSTEGEPAIQIEFATLLSVLLIVSGAWFAVSGVAGLAGGAIGVAQAGEYTRDLSVQRLGSSAVYVLGGSGLAWLGRRTLL